MYTGTFQGQSHHLEPLKQLPSLNPHRSWNDGVLWVIFYQNDFYFFLSSVILKILHDDFVRDLPSSRSSLGELLSWSMSVHFPEELPFYSVVVLVGPYSKRGNHSTLFWSMSVHIPIGVIILLFRGSYQSTFRKG